jgi:uncharacterized protein
MQSPTTNGPARRKLRFRFIAGKFAVCRFAADAPSPAWSVGGPFLSITRTAEELSIVCLSETVPANVKAERDWTCFKLEGPFPFQETGILAAFIGPLAENGIPIFAISTFDTDYVLIKEDFVGMALSVLAGAGHELL